MGDCMSKERADQDRKSEETTERSPVMSQPSSSGIVSIGAHVKQSDKHKDKKKNKSKTAEQSKKQNDVDKPQHSMDMTQAGNKQVTGATAVITSGASGISNSSVPAETSKRPTILASSSNTSEKVVHDKDRSKSEISVHSTVSMENVQVLVAETQDALTKQDVLQKKERDVQAELDKAIMNVEASKGQIQKLKDELEDAENKRKAAEKDAEDKTKQLEDARKELEKEKQQNELRNKT